MRMLGLRTVLRAACCLLLVLAVPVAPAAAAAASDQLAAEVEVEVGSINGADFLIEIPPNWNHDLVLYSHGYVAPGQTNPARDVGDPLTRQYLLGLGYALAGSAYKSTGWAIEDALVDQIDLLDHFDRIHGRPHRTIAWGHSLGGMITAGLVQRDPRRFAGALPMCGVVAGGVGVWNTALDSEFAFKTLLGSGSGLQLVDITNPTQNLITSEQLLGAAQQNPAGRARIALSAAVGDLPGWFSQIAPEPAANDFATREQNQFLWDSQVDFPFIFDFRAELEHRAGGNPSWNTGVDYRRLLNGSIDRDEVQALYQAAGLDMDTDLRTLAQTPRVAADRSAVNYLIRNIVFNGELHGVPVLTMHTTGDGLVLNQDEQSYHHAVVQAGDQELLRQTFVHRAGHCTFTPAETIAAFNALVHRLDSHRWSGLSPADLNAAAAALGTTFNVQSVTLPGQQVPTIVPTPPAYLSFTPTRFLRPFTLGDGDRDED